MSTYIVQGMTCGGCVRSVTSAIERAVPGARVQVDLQTGRVAVDGAHQPEQIRQAIEEAGFEFVGADAG